MIVFFFRLAERMIVHDSFSVNGGNKSGLKEKKKNNNNKAITWTNIRTTVALKARKWEKRKNLKKPGNEKSSGSLICNLIDENEAQPCLWKIFCDDYHNRDATGNNTAFKFNVWERITSVSKKVLGSDAGTLRDLDTQINLKQRLGMFVKKEKLQPRWDSNPQTLH